MASAPPAPGALGMYATRPGRCPERVPLIAVVHTTLWYQNAGMPSASPGPRSICKTDHHTIPSHGHGCGGSSRAPRQHTTVGVGRPAASGKTDGSGRSKSICTQGVDIMVTQHASVCILGLGLPSLQSQGRGLWLHWKYHPLTPGGAGRSGAELDVTCLGLAGARMGVREHVHGAGCGGRVDAEPLVAVHLHKDVVGDCTARMDCARCPAGHYVLAGAGRNIPS
jgi:hypothetical protein